VPMCDRLDDRDILAALEAQPPGTQLGLLTCDIQVQAVWVERDQTGRHWRVDTEPKSPVQIHMECNDPRCVLNLVVGFGVSDIE